MKKDLTGQQFGRLTVLKRVEDHITPNGSKKVVYLCQCSCGAQKAVRSNSLLTGRTVSCGCYNVENSRSRFTTHGLRKSKAYSTWCGIKTRCLNPNGTAYKNYGGRGIKICEEWADSFITFYEYASKLPHAFEDGYSIDRIDNSGNYEPGNIRFATPHEQSMNTRRNRNAVRD